MGSSYKRAILGEQITNAIRQWHDKVRDKRKRHQTPEMNDNGDNNNRDIDSGESPIQSEVVSDFRFSDRQPPILQEISIQSKPKGDEIDEK